MEWLGHVGTQHPFTMFPSETNFLFIHSLYHPESSLCAREYYPEHHKPLGKCAGVSVFAHRLHHFLIRGHPTCRVIFKNYIFCAKTVPPLPLIHCNRLEAFG